ncbi:STAS domain-containing protein [Nocardia carnea]|uniref:STAS domain-containing protein n=1 Tax=Nocardia carnea TaxID=37328 RepID=UPI0024552147|nr:STAS domain-containing protein [Nocardia carnea]
MSVTTALYQVEQHRGNDPRTAAAGRMWSRRSTEYPDCLIARVEGELDAVGLDDFRALLGRCQHDGCRVVVLDLRATTFLCIRAASALSGAKNDAWRHGVELRLVSGRRDIERVLQVTGARHQFRYFPTLRAALTG